MNLLRLSFFPTLVLVAAGSESIAAQEPPGKQSSSGTAIRAEFKYQPGLRVTEELPLFAALDPATPEEEIIRLPNYVVRELPDSTKRDLDLALAQRQKLSSGAVVGKNLGKQIRFEAILPIWLDQNVKGHPVFRFDVFRLGW
jgi:hypothetical protein